ncbi:hypothetical protein [Pelagibacterium halotolerans]|uniref:hypothetical protein n=1 Tax=Pelagibacterium halotolerans TaxID=531813 RepID=UPI0038516A42
MAKTLLLMRQFALNDFRLGARDSFLVMMAGMALAIGIVFRFLLPWADIYLAEAGLLPNPATNLRLSDLYPMLVSFIGVFQSAVLVGAIFGFLFLDEKDGDTLRALLVTPVRFSTYLAYRLTMPAIVTFLLTLVIVPLIGQAQIGWPKLVVVAAGASPAASLIVLFYALTAENKVQGFAMAKFVAIAGWIIPVAWFLPDPWQWLAALFPPYLAHKAYWMAEAGAAYWWLPLAAGFVWQIAVLAIMAKRFHTSVRA